METVYGFTRVYRVILWFAVLVFAALAGFLLWNGAGALFHLAGFSGLPGNLGIAALVLFSVVGLVLMCVISIRLAWRTLKFTVGISDHAVRIGDATVAREDTVEVAHPPFAFGVAFRVVTRDGRSLDVYSGVQNTRQIEEEIRIRAFGHEPDLGE